MRPLRIPVCPLPGNCPGYYLPSNLPPDHPQANRLIPCACTLARLAAVIQTELPPAIRRMTFGVFRETDENRKALTVARQFADAIWEQTKYFLTLIGPNRKGKTHLAAAIVNSLLVRSELAQFESVPALLDYLRAGYGSQANEDFDQRLEKVKDAPVLVLDDLGAESGHGEQYEVTWAQDKLYQIVDHRLIKELPTIFTTNLLPDMLPKRIASRLWDRQCGIVVAITAGDERGTKRIA
jgi:DNA replication protein DnaC